MNILEFHGGTTVYGIAGYKYRIYCWANARGYQSKSLYNHPSLEFGDPHIDGFLIIWHSSCFQHMR